MHVKANNRSKHDSGGGGWRTNLPRPLSAVATTVALMFGLRVIQAGKLLLLI